jgi:hypothetical protein
MWICKSFKAGLWVEYKRFNQPLKREFALVPRHEREPFRSLEEKMVMAYFRMSRSILSSANSFPN